MNRLSAIGAREHIRGVRAGSIQHLVLIFPGALGDLLLVLPTLRRLRRRHAPARTILVVAEPQRGLARLLGVADTVASLDETGAAWLFGADTPPRWLVPGSVVFSWLGSDPTLGARLAQVAGAAHLLSVERAPGHEHAAVAYARAAGVAGDRRRLAADAGIAPPDSARARTLIAGLRRPLLAMHRGAGSRAKRWATDGFATVAGWWRRSQGDVVDLLGPAEAGDAPLDGAVVSGWSLPDVAALLALTDAYLGNDSGVSHLAGAVGARGVVLFGPTDPARWRPLAPGLAVLRSRVNDRESPSRPYPSPERVCKALASLSAGSAACARSGSASLSPYACCARGSPSASIRRRGGGSSSPAPR
jgi:ADP-heptose:LPS heptosyltransferase